jgi:hypothetical protein
MFLAVIVHAAPPRAGDKYKGIKLDKTQHAGQAVLPVAVTVNEYKIIKPWSSFFDAWLQSFLALGKQDYHRSAR